MRARAVAPERTGDGRVVSGFWFGLPIESNPWAGERPQLLVEIRTRMFGLSPMPDGPPDARIAKQIGRTLVEGMSGYAAFYRQEQARVAVYALRSEDPQEWTRSSLPEKDDGTVSGFLHGSGRQRYRRWSWAIAVRVSRHWNSMSAPLHCERCVTEAAGVSAARSRIHA